MCIALFLLCITVFYSVCLQIMNGFSGLWINFPINEHRTDTMRVKGKKTKNKQGAFVPPLPPSHTVPHSWWICREEKDWRQVHLSHMEWTQCVDYYHERVSAVHVGLRFQFNQLLLLQLPPVSHLVWTESCLFLSQWGSWRKVSRHDDDPVTRREQVLRDISPNMAIRSWNRGFGSEISEQPHRVMRNIEECCGVGSDPILDHFWVLQDVFLMQQILILVLSCE